MSNSNVIELFNQQPSLAMEEDFIALYEEDNSYIYYLRSYVSQQEVIVLSHDLLGLLPQELRPITNIIFQCNFNILKQFKSQIQHYLWKNNLMSHFYYLFNTPIDEVFN